MEIKESITVVIKSPKDYEILQALVATYEYFTQFGVDADWIGYDDAKGYYTVIFCYEGNENRSSNDRKNDILDMLTYIEAKKYFFP